MPQPAENIVTQEEFPMSPVDTPTASGDEGGGTQFLDSNQDVEMDQPRLARVVVNPLFIPDPQSPLHNADHASGSQLSLDRYFPRPTAKRPTDSEYTATDPMKRMKRTYSMSARRANKQLLDETERQKQVLKDQETRLLETVSQQQVILQEFRKVQQQIVQERDDFQQRLAQAAHEKANRETELLKEIEAIKVRHCRRCFTIC